MAKIWHQPIKYGESAAKIMKWKRMKIIENNRKYPENNEISMAKSVISGINGEINRNRKCQWISMAKEMKINGENASMKENIEIIMYRNIKQ
jgi:putative transposon-encoded protein